MVTVPSTGRATAAAACNAKVGVESLLGFLLGTWILESYVEHALDGTILDEPFGRDAQGMLIYAADGFMSAHLMPANRAPFVSGDLFSPTLAELKQASRVVMYSGRYVVDERARLVTHEVDLSFFPNWIGQAQVRRVEQREGRLVLTPAKAFRAGGKVTLPRLTWVRPTGSLLRAR